MSWTPEELRDLQSEIAWWRADVAKGAPRSITPYVRRIQNRSPGRSLREIEAKFRIEIIAEKAKAGAA